MYDVERRDLYANYIMGVNWDLYVTQTFKYRNNDALTAISRWWGMLDYPSVRAFVAAEKHRNGGFHLHALLADDHPQPITSVWLKNRQDKFLGWSSVSPIKNVATVSLYCAKYVCKSGFEYAFLGNDSWAWEAEHCLTKGV